MGYLPPRGPNGRRRDMVKPFDIHEFIYELVIGWSRSAFGHGPSIFTKSPQELDFDAIRERNRMSYAMKHFPKREPTPPGYIRVHFFASLDLFRQMERKPNLVALIPLEPSGELDLKRVRDVWGLDSCSPIDPLRWTTFGPTSDRLSPLAVHILAERHAAINFIEPHVSGSTRRKRAIRARFVPWWQWMRNTYHINQFRVEDFVQRHTSLIIWHQEAVQWGRGVVWRVEKWMSEHDEVLRMLFALLILAFILLIVSVTGGFIDLGLSNYAMSWVGAGMKKTTEMALS
ncbi:hypothetical protein BDZ94DRAFT_1272796 [Collybia nuda]|uniref:Uncharacterized protein n=1 Tax=Collybia nuda TaxID=64659 RepID=A0A9P6CCZ1_9AGAR|nr:hypothetical protein BDZ94DRAFT_1272796 [Collybia nuda]